MRKTLFVLALSIALAGFGGRGIAGAQTPAPTPPPGAVGVLQLHIEDSTFHWVTITGAQSYRLTGTVVGAEGLPGETRCETFARVQPGTVNLDQTLGADVTSFAFASPPAGAQFYVNSMNVTLDALNANGDVLASSPIRFFGPESFTCPTPAAGAPGATLQPPATGDGASGADARSGWIVLVVSLCALAGVASTGGVLLRRR
jgi:hypothetical protein